jgi:hypothetical protein
MESGENNERSNENQGIEKYDAASCIEEECLKDAAEFNAMMEEDEAAAEDEEYFDDASFDDQIEDLDWESGEDPFDAREWQIIRNNLEP